ncbi:hypothetical protein [Fictibacillus terranigra]|uniref:LysM domain-containing protein n=1 Tax=Fictibacillus terranigra TaxID=3058424 RepID=A0ABT8EA33_9BACL|nr:hypothetical protein [Fictibacillus sp. CENA-BCM004]MDN4074773.1 hypothetical protein [Fictibacillus sp. CENA-BCM004]
MKKFLLFCLSLLIVYTIAYDLKIGTLQSYSSKPAPVAAVSIKNSIPYKKVKVSSGDTVLSIIEKVNPESLSKPIPEIIRDFQRYNHNIRPEGIQVGKMYNFPVYKQVKH